MGNKAFVRYTLCDSHLKLYSKTLRVSEPGIYKVVWHNSYSYIKPKVVKYRLRVLSPLSAEPKKASSVDELLSCGSLTPEEESEY